MHDLEFEHVHVEGAEETREVREAIWAADNVELTTVGIDIGSSTSHLMFARVHLSRLATGLSSRFVVVERKVLWQSPILLTPYLPDYTIDTVKLAAFINNSYAEAGLTRIEEPAIALANSLGIDLRLGGKLKARERERLVDRMCRLVIAMMNRQRPDELASRLLVTEPWPEQLAGIAVDAVTFSGGVAE